MKKPKLYMILIYTEDGHEWELFASDVETDTEALSEARKEFIESEMYNDEDVFELYPVDEVSGYKITLTK